MPSALTTSFLGAFQASLSVLLTLSYGVIAARLELLKPETAGDVGQLCVKMFLPALLITNVGSQLQVDRIGDYLPAFIWAILYSTISLLLGTVFVRIFKLPAWVTPAMGFNNSTSLPLLLTEALATTQILSSIAGDDLDGAVARAKSYFLINSMVSNAMTFAIGPRLLQITSGAKDEEDGEHSSATESEESEEDREDAEQADESTSLLPKPIQTAAESAADAMKRAEERLPQRLQRLINFSFTLVNPPLVGALISIFVGLIPPIHTLLFAPMAAGGWLNAWFTSSIRNMGNLFTALQMFVVGSRLNSSLSSDGPIDVGSWPAFICVFLFRFFIWPAISIPLIYVLATHGIIGKDPILWFAMMLMPVGPPAMVLSSLAEVAGCGKEQKGRVARVLAGMYVLSPVVFVAVVGSLRACESVLEKRGEGEV